ncbi:MAG: glycosyltransferase family 1 protein [Chloroflexi bacterium]|nr:glycosyltransferase family 1 protein [Chloroflexota bacterium]
MNPNDHLPHPPPNGFDLPRRLRRLADLAYNLWWTWHAESSRIFRYIDADTWELTEHNPVRFLRLVPSERLRAATNSRWLLEFYDRVVRAFDDYMGDGPAAWYPRTHPDRMNQPIAYFSTEFGLHESLPIYAGGLGILSGDHLKEASDLGMPLVAVGFLYPQGYFKQRLNDDGWQEARYASLAYTDLPVHPVFDASGGPLTITVDLPGRPLHARLWRIQVGRVPLFLLDSDVDGNAPGDRTLTSRLYTSDLELRISQEILLGIGGVRALRALGYNPAVWHMNEGHSAFLVLERARELVAAGRPYAEAMERVRASSLFTTHTPVPAGNDEFPLWLVDKYFSGFWPQLGLEREAFVDLARRKEPWGETFSMPVLAIRNAERINGVSELHGQVARRMWSFLWPKLPAEQAPIGHITNGVHTGTWLARRLWLLFDRYFEPGWSEHLDDPQTWEAIERIPDAELWGVRRHLKRKLVAYMRERARRQWIGTRVHPVQVIAGGVLLDPYALTIGFARRFATYKRASLILHDVERLLRLVHRPGMPVQVIFAGKAHPADEPGKLLIQEVYRQVKRAETGGRLVFLEDYDINLARYLVQGVDLWLNTPRRPNEASGTSGQKAALNGALNLSVLDGWWREGYNGRNGWAIGDESEAADPAARDAADAESLYRRLEDEIIPLYYLERSADGLPAEWLGMVKESMRTLGPRFSMRRMLRQYVETMYLPALPDPDPIKA